MKHRNAVPRNQREVQSRTHALRALSRARRGEPISKAARAEHVKLSTVKKFVGNQHYQDAPGKRLKSTKSDRLTARMNIMTPLGLTTVLVRGSRERSRLGRYNIALAKWRRGRPGADAELKAFEGQKVGGHTLITDVRLLASPEDAGAIEFNELYSSIAGR